MSFRSRVRALLALAALAVGVVGFPVVLVAIHAPPSTDPFSWSRLTAPDDGTLAVALITIVAWLAWATFAGAVVLEIASRVRGIPTPRLPGLTLPQLTAGQLVALASLLFVATPAVTSAVSMNHAVAAAPEPRAQSQDPIPVETGAQPTRAPAPAPENAEEPSTPYVVKRGDSLWRIAEAHLGDGKRYGEIVDLNRRLLGGQPDFLVAGTVLQLPVVDPASSEPGDEQVVVRAGDTLSSIAAEQLDDADRYREIFRQSRSIQQHDGRRIEDPDLILPGWRLKLPGNEQPRLEAVPAPAPTPTRPEPPPPHPTPADASDEATTPDADETEDGGSAQPDWVVRGLAGTGAALAGAMLLVLRQRRRTQSRFRCPGEVIAPPPPELRDVEKTAQLSGSVTAPKIEALDRALRALVSELTHRPALDYVSLGQERFCVRFAETLDAMPPRWTGAGTEWSCPLEGGPPVDPEQIAPYPMLVSVGQAANDELVLVDLEALGTLRLAGDTDKTADLARHIAAELSLNPWAELVEMDTLGIASELAEIDPVRMRHHADADTQFLDRLASTLETEPATEPDRFRAVVAWAADHPDLARVVKMIAARSGRTGATVVHLADVGDPDEAVFELTPDGRVLGGPLGDDVAAAGLSSQDAAACAAILDLTRDAQSVALPVSKTNDAIDVSGAVRQEFTSPRPEGAAGSDSLLPKDSNEYLEVAATTADDIERLAPIVPAASRDTVRAKDPTLDHDLSLWFDEDALVPRLRLLGPVSARAFGNPRAVAKRKPFYIEVLAYLVLHPTGVTSAEVADAFGLTTPRTRVDIAVLRSWLGENPNTGEPHLPSAETARSTSGDGARRYRVDGVLTDLDLFRRLRTRGQANGQHGIEDLRTALSLVSGEPFSHLRPAGWSWLLDGDRIDHIMTCAVADVSHLVVTRALSEDDIVLARWAAELGHHAAPSDETSRLDLIQVAAASGHADLAAQQLASEVLNRCDDNLGPIDLPERTNHLLGRKGQHRRPMKP